MKTKLLHFLYFLSNRVRAHTRTHPPPVLGTGGGSLYADFWVDDREKSGREGKRH